MVYYGVAGVAGGPSLGTIGCISNHRRSPMSMLAGLFRWFMPPTTAFQSAVWFRFPPRKDGFVSKGAHMAVSTNWGSISGCPYNKSDIIWGLKCGLLLRNLD